MEQSTERKNKIINKKIETTSKENCIKKVFERLRKEKEKAFIPFLTIGDPDEKTFLHIVEKIKNDIDILELGIPFSDPIADGKTIQKANHRALNKGINLQSSFSLIKKAKQIIKKPIVLLTYANILGLGEQREYSLKRFKKAGVDGIIIADVPVEEAGNYHRLLTKYGIKLILLATPQTTEKRFQKMYPYLGGFLYLVSVSGTTGARKKIKKKTAQLIRKISSFIHKREKNIPICLGFGISKPQHIKDLQKTDLRGIIVGSAIIKRIENSLGNKKEIIENVGTFIKNMKNATRCDL